MRDELLQNSCISSAEEGSAVASRPSYGDEGKVGKFPDVTHRRVLRLEEDQFLAWD